MHCRQYGVNPPTCFSFHVCVRDGSKGGVCETKREKDKKEFEDKSKFEVLHVFVDVMLQVWFTKQFNH